MRDPKFLISGLALFMAFVANAEAKLYKWVDDKGETHYSETIPPEYANRQHIQLNKEGREIKKKTGDEADAGGRKTAEEQAAIDQRRKDKALLDTYSNEKEIDLARDRNLQQVEARINSIKIRLQSAQSTLDAHRKERDGYTKAGKKIPAPLQSDLDEDTANLTRLQQELGQAQQEGDTIRARYDADKVRYRELTGGQ
jgi:chromosome segregation ATPase